MQQRCQYRVLVLLSVVLATLVVMFHAERVANAGDLEEGAKLYQQRCASCHGADGKAHTPIAQALTPKPRDHTDGAYMNKLSNEHLTKVIKGGGSAVGRSPLMPPQPDLNDTQIQQLVTFVRSLAVPPYKGN